MRSCRLVVRTLPFHGGNVRANRARSDMFPSFNWIGCPIRFLGAMRVRVPLGTAQSFCKRLMIGLISIHLSFRAPGKRLVLLPRSSLLCHSLFPLLIRKEFMDLSQTLLTISMIVLMLLVIADLKYSIDRIRKIDKLMRLVRRGEVSYIQFVNEVLDNIIAG